MNCFAINTSLTGIALLLLSACVGQPSTPAVEANTQVQSPVAVESARVHKAARREGRVLDSRWLKPVVGEREESIGARVESVEAVPDSESVAVGIALPPGDKIEEVIVYGRAQKTRAREPILQPARVEVLSSPEKNGIVIYLPNLEDFSLRINYYEPPSDVVPDLIKD